MANPLRAAWDYIAGPHPAVQQASQADIEKKLYYDPILPAIRAGVLVHGPGATQIYDDAWGKGRDGNSAVFACLMALSMAHIEPPVKVWQRVVGDNPRWLSESPLQQLLEDPNPWHDQLEIWFWTQWARHLDGNAYLRKVRAGDAITGNVIELWPISPGLIKPVTEKGSKRFIDYYRYDYAPGKWDPIPVENMIHFRIGIDDRDHRLGLAPIKRLLREVASDDEATQFADALLRNYGIPGLVVVPPAGANLTLEQAQELKERIASEFGADNRGNVGVLSPGADMKQFGFSPEQMNLKGLHDVPETRIAAVMGVPPAVAGLGVGLDQTSNFASMKQVRENFTEVKLVPTWRMDAAKLNKQLKPDFTDERDVFIEHDLSDVRALQEDRNQLFTRLDNAVKTGWITPNEARSEVGKEPMAGGDEAMKPQPSPLAAAPPVVPPAKNSRVIELKAGEIDAETLQALVDLAEPALAEELAGYFDEARRRTKRRLIGRGS